MYNMGNRISGTGSGGHDQRAGSGGQDQESTGSGGHDQEHRLRRTESQGQNYSRQGKPQKKFLDYSGPTTKREGEAFFGAQVPITTMLVGEGG